MVLWLAQLAALAVVLVAVAGGEERGAPVAVRLHGWNAFVAFKHYPVVMCTVPKVGCTALRQWVLERAPEQLAGCEEEMKRNNTQRLRDPACKSLEHFRNLTMFKRSGMTKFKAHCRQRHMDPSEYLLGKERCMANTASYSLLRRPKLPLLQSKFTATFVRHPVDRFISWFVDKVLMAPSDHSMRHVPRSFDLALLSQPGYGVSAMVRSFRDAKHRFLSCNPVLDEHYATQTCMCRHDVVKYNFVGRLESMRRDFALFAGEMSRRWDRSHGTELAPSSRLPSDMNVKGKNDYSKNVRGNITMEDVLSLYEIYQEDFLNFNYTIAEWWKKYKY